MDKYLWAFYWDRGRQGSVEGLFVATEEEIKKAIGEYVSFGEILGKHSDVYGTIEDCDITKVDLDSETVEKVEKVLGDTWSGYNPLEYVRYTCNVCEDSLFKGDMYEIGENAICTYCKYTQKQDDAQKQESE